MAILAWYLCFRLDVDRNLLVSGLNTAAFQSFSYLTLTGQHDRLFTHCDLVEDAVSQRVILPASSPQYTRPFLCLTRHCVPVCLFILWAGDVIWMMLPRPYSVSLSFSHISIFVALVFLYHQLGVQRYVFTVIRCVSTTSVRLNRGLTGFCSHFQNKGRAIPLLHKKLELFRVIC